MVITSECGFQIKTRFNSVKKEGLQLKDHAKMPSDIKQLDSDLGEVKRGWANLQQISQAFTGDLQNSLVSSGRLIEAVENLEEWIMKVEPELSDLKQIDGDVFTVHNLIEQHRYKQWQLVSQYSSSF